MSRIAPLATHDADAQTAATLAAVKSKLGMVPNLFSTFARAPAVLQGYLAFSESLGQGRLSFRQREIVALVIAQANHCMYCLAAHSAIGKSAGMDEVAIRQARLGQLSDPLEQALAELSLRLVSQRGLLNESDLASAKAAGLDDTHILEVVANVAINLLTNYTNLVAQTDIDFPAVAAQA